MEGGRLYLTGVEVLILLGEVLILVHPFAVALEEDLQGGRGSAPQLDGVALDDVGVLRLLDEVRQRALHGGKGVRLSITCGTCRPTPGLLIQPTSLLEEQRSKCTECSENSILFYKQ